MKRRFDAYPLDLVLLGAAVLVAAVAVALDLRFLRLLVGAPLVMFLPGYSLVFLLFPERRLPDEEAAIGLQGQAAEATTEQDLDRLDYQMRRQRGVLSGIERAAVSTGASLCLVGLAGIALDLTGIGVFLGTFLGTLLVLSAILAGFGVRRWYAVPRERRWALELTVTSTSLGRSTGARVLSVVLLVAAVAASATVLDALVDPDPPGRTRLYLLGQLGDLRCYPTAWEGGTYRASLSASERDCPPEVGNITVGIINLERRTVDYWVRAVWSQGYDVLSKTEPTAVLLVDEWNQTVEPHPEADHFTQYGPGAERPFTVPPPPGNGTWRLDIQVFKQPPEPVEVTGAYLRSAYSRAHITVTTDSL